MNASARSLESASAAPLQLQGLKGDLDEVFTLVCRKLPGIAREVAQSAGALAIEAGGRAGELTLF